MTLKNDWLWDRKLTIKQARDILRDPAGRHFLSISADLLARKNAPKEVFKYYLKPLVFVQNWNRIKRQMRKDDWNNPRIKYWQAIYEVAKGRYAQAAAGLKQEAGGAGVKDIFCKTVADKIKLARRQKGFTQGALAQKLKVSQQAVSRIEKGRENISLSTFKRIADALGVTIDVNVY